VAASEIVCTDRRACAAPDMCSRRLSIHFTGRPSAIAAIGTSASSA